MKLKNKIITAAFMGAACFNASAADKLLTFDFHEAVEAGYAQGVLDRNIKFYLAGQAHPAIKTNYGQYKSNKKTRRLGKSSEESCDWALLSALKTFQQRAYSLKANAVINIKSNYKSNEYSDPKQYQCGSGFIMAGVALKADVAKLK